ncbi:glycosyltransferase family 9 protein [Phenylobacterium sp.]|jgi:ADP-heptose:LPS heptosyltransferase|uniref:glycosyltransferase family 9 protein n=1 Tax=Phenylobacterium sp. TaxID=1871053 RepID=UPI000C951F6F|nr:glycosyltransferase family 9 protein [Phenylobacterium sp.]MAK83169.1 ADP-heptose--LPS heptosyltransferase [Phenylobacterium sp.]|tara:strand:+ start:8746 stop:9735 length:990 start_codon:yes stop_codon:yes gene_type:complete
MTQGSFPILFITATRIGDAVLSSGLLAKLREEIPNARFTIVAGPAAAPLFADTPGLDEVIVFQKARNGGHWLALWNRVRHRRWGLVVDLRGSAMASFVRTKRRAIFRRQPGPAVHKVIEAARLLKLEDEPPAPHIFTSPETEAAAAALTRGEGPILALAPAANWVGKTWPLERFAQLAIRLLGEGGALQGARLMVLGSPDDSGVVASLRHVVPKARFIDLVGKTDLLTGYAALRHARLFVGNDSGLMHMAAAAGAPTLGLFGPSDDTLYAPWGPHTRVVRGARSFEQIRLQDPDLNQSFCHMMDLSVDTVAQAANQLLKQTEMSHGRHL